MSAPTLEVLVAHLIGIAAIYALTGNRVFGLELPPGQAATMPRACIVIGLAGDISGAQDATYTRIGGFRVDLFNYGATPLEALQVSRVSHDAMKAIHRAEKIVSGAGGLIYRANKSGGPIYSRDPEGNWPVVVESWQVLAAETVTT